MKKTFLLTQNGLSLTTAKWLFIIVGFLNLVIAIHNLSEIPLTTWGLIFGVLLLFSGLYSAFLGFILFNPTNMLAPKFVIDDNEIKIRKYVHAKTTTIQWNDIKEIDFKPFELDFLFKDNSNKSITLQTNSYTSIEIKKSLLEIAEKKSINVVGG